jgi:hypothetical protein
LEPLAEVGRHASVRQSFSASDRHQETYHPHVVKSERRRY